MDLNYVRKLVKLLSESSLSELEIEEEEEQPAPGGPSDQEGGA